MIDLFNHRFIAFYFNRSGQGEGGDDAATALVDGQTENPYAYLAAFAPDGRILGETELYADKDAVFEWALGLLRDHPEYARPASGEGKLRAGADALEGNRLAVARLDEKLGDYGAASAEYERLLEANDRGVAHAAGVGLLRIERYGKRWQEHAAIEASLRKRTGLNASTLVDLDIERGRRLLAIEQVTAARDILQGVTRRATGHRRLAEAHFYAGVACWFDGDRPWAKLHWCWVGERLKKDRLWRRAYIAAAAEGMPYANAELGGFAANVGNIGVGDILRAYGRAVRVYEGLLPIYEAGENRGEAPEDADGRGPIWARAQGKAPKLVAALRDGNANVPANNAIVDQLVGIGALALEPLMAAIEDRSFGGRGYAGWALGSVLATLEDRPRAALEALDRASNDVDDYVRTLSRSGRSRLVARAQPSVRAQDFAAGSRRAAAEPQAPFATESALLLVAGLVDGNGSLDANNARVDRLVDLGERSLPALLAAMDDGAFPGRGYAGWALSQVLKENGIDSAAALEALRGATRDDDMYVRTLARSGLSTIR